MKQPIVLLLGQRVASEHSTVLHEEGDQGVIDGAVFLADRTDPPRAHERGHRLAIARQEGPIPEIRSSFRGVRAQHLGPIRLGIEAEGEELHPRLRRFRKPPLERPGATRAP